MIKSSVDCCSSMSGWAAPYEMVDQKRLLTKPLIIFDGKCGFCRRAVARWRNATGNAIDYAPFQELADPFAGVSHTRFSQSVHLILDNGEIFTGAHAVLKALSDGAQKKWPLWAYRHLPGAARIAEFGYRLVANHRAAASRFAAFLWK